MKRTTAPGSSSGLYVDDNPALGVVGTLLVAEDRNATQEELANLITGAGLSLSGADLTQVLQAVKTFAYLPMRNILVNGDMRIDQRNEGTTKTFTAAAGRAYGVDRWFVQCTGANVTGQRVAGDVGKYAYKITGAASNTQTRFGQIIEAENAASLKSRVVTVSLYAKADSARTVTWRAYHANAADDWTGSTEIANGTIDLTTSAALKTFSFNAGANAGNGISIELRTESALLAGAYVQYELVQLEVGAFNTPFEHRPFGSELRLCQRYFEKSFPIGVKPANSGDTNPQSYNSQVSFCIGMQEAGISAHATHSYKVTKRGTTQMTAYGSSTGSWYRLRIPSAGGDLVTVTFTVFNHGFSVTQGPAIGDGNASVAFGHWTADAEF